MSSPPTQYTTMLHPSSAMSLRRVAAVALLNATLLMRDPGPVVAYVAMPLLLMFFLAPVYGLSQHNSDAGNAQAVAGMTVMFAMFTINVMGTSFFSEHGWRTWARLRATPATSIEIMVGKALPLLAILVAQAAALMGVGVVALGVPERGSPAAVVTVLGAYQLAVLALGLCLVSLARTRGQLGVMADAGGMLFACVGGALVPTSILPSWARPAAPFIPSHWAMEGITGAMQGGSFTRSLGAVAILLGFASVFLALATARYRSFEQRATT
jgi:ABC-2 type transport system permease protein